MSLLASLNLYASDGLTPDRKIKDKLMTLYVGTYTGPKSKGIYSFDFDSATGRLAARGLAAEVANPSFLAFAPNRRFMYCVNEGGDFAGQKTGSVSALAIDASSGNLTLLNQQPSQGLWPCHLSVDPTGRYVLTANYGSGTVTVLPIGPDGQLLPPTSTVQHQGKGPDIRRQEGPHAHSVNFDPTGQLILAADLGTDRLQLYRLDADTGTLRPSDPAFAALAPGAGPRHLAFGRGGAVAYVINELNGSISVFTCDAARGVLTELQTVPTLPAGFTGQSICAEVQVHPNGRFVYGSNRGHDSIAIFAVDTATGTLTPAGHEPTLGKHPRNFTIDPTGQFLIVANKDSDNLVVFSIAGTTGRLTHVQTVELAAPVCVRFMPAS